MIDRYLIRYFLAVIDAGSFTRAALQCRVSQPTLSVGIAKLEAIVGAAVFHRTNRRVELTGAGARFATHARRIESEFAAAERALRDSPQRPIIRIGVATTLPVAWLESALARARATGSAERLEMVEGRMRDLLPMLDRGRVNTVIGPTDPGGGRVLFAEPYRVALPAGHALAASVEVDPADLSDEPMIVRRQCEALPHISRFFTDRGIRPFMAARTNSDERAIAFVRVGLGITVMPACFASAGAVFRPLKGLRLERTICALTRVETPLVIDQSAAYRAFCARLGELGAADAS